MLDVRNESSGAQLTPDTLTTNVVRVSYRWTGLPVGRVSEEELRTYLHQLDQDGIKCLDPEHSKRLETRRD